MAKELPKIKPCPFLKHQRKQTAFTTFADDGLWWRVWCAGCGAFGPQRKTERSAIEAWNRAPREGE